MARGELVEEPVLENELVEAKEVEDNAAVEVTAGEATE